MRRRGLTRRVDRRGFTLLEVLAAVAIIAITFTYLAAAGIEGIQLEADSERRLRASLIADEVVSDLEALAATGSAPPVGEEESQRDDLFLVRTRVEPYRAPVASPVEESLEARRRRRNEPAPSIVDFQGEPDDSPLRVAQIEVSWSDGVRERSVFRTTFLMDRPLAQALLQQAGVPLEGRGAVAAGEEAEADDDEESEGRDDRAQNETGGRR